MSSSRSRKKFASNRPGARKRADRRLAGDEGLHGQRDVADAIRPRQELRGLGRHHAAVGADIGAHVGADMPAHGEDRAVALCTRSRSRNRPRANDWSRQMLAAVLDPFHRPADQPRRERDQEILGIELALDAEAAADVDLDHVDVVFGDAEHRRERAAVEEQHLGGAEHGQPRFAASHSAIWPRVSSGRPVSRWQRNVSLRVYSALANAASASPNDAS